MHRMVDAQRRERNVIVAEVARIKGLMPLLMKRRNGYNWSRAERVELHDQLSALAHLSPYLFVQGCVFAVNPLHNCDLRSILRLRRT